MNRVDDCMRLRTTKNVNKRLRTMDARDKNIKRPLKSFNPLILTSMKASYNPVAKCMLALDTVHAHYRKNIDVPYFQQR